uniref:Uncharacterized protein n=1 Tax=Cacopsylla melanoneura TaxID=428564 RepID=A0A8D8XXN6_9HEMI
MLNKLNSTWSSLNHLRDIVVLGGVAYENPLFQLVGFLIFCFISVYEFYDLLWSHQSVSFSPSLQFSSSLSLSLSPPPPPPPPLPPPPPPPSPPPPPPPPSPPPPPPSLIFCIPKYLFPHIKNTVTDYYLGPTTT